MSTVMHALTAPEAHAVCCVLNATEHIPVAADVDAAGTVNLWPQRAVTDLEEVTAIRAFCSVTNLRINWHAAGAL